MNGTSGKRFGRLAAAERFYDLKLKEAQLAQADAEQVLVAEEGKKHALELEIEALDLYRRELTDKPVALDAARLDYVYRYAAWVAARLDEQLAVLAEAQRECEAKHDRTRGCFEDMAVLKRVYERREASRKLENERAAQKTLDAHAALKASGEILQDDSG